MTDKPKTKFMVVGTQLIPVVMLNDSWAVPASNIIQVDEKTPIFDSKADANYFNLVKKLDSGVSIDTYKKSKFYEFYKDKLEKENPEHIL